MLTPADLRPDGGMTKYLEQQPQCDDHDLFDKLKQIGQVADGQRLRFVERSGIVPRAIFFGEFLSDRIGLRRAFFREALEHLGRADVIFFDPDNGLAPPSVPKGAANSAKYIYPDEIHETYHAGHSVLVYQHFAREARAAYIDRIGADLSGSVSTAGLWCFWTPHTAFFLLVHPRHSQKLAAAAEMACSRWNANFMRGNRLFPNGTNRQD